MWEGRGTNFWELFLSDGVENLEFFHELFLFSFFSFLPLHFVNFCCACLFICNSCLCGVIFRVAALDL
jgi:hypothetical protein